MIVWTIIWVTFFLACGWGAAVHANDSHRRKLVGLLCAMAVAGLSWVRAFYFAISGNLLMTVVDGLIWFLWVLILSKNWDHLRGHWDREHPDQAW